MPFTSQFVSPETGIVRFSYVWTAEQNRPGFVQSARSKIEIHLLTSEFYTAKNAGVKTPASA